VVSPWFSPIADMSMAGSTAIKGSEAADCVMARTDRLIEQYRHFGTFEKCGLAVRMSVHWG
jgi:hypothetical protein